MIVNFYKTLTSVIDIQYSRHRIFNSFSEKVKINTYFVGNILMSIIYACLIMGTMMVSGIIKTTYLCLCLTFIFILFFYHQEPSDLY